MMPLGNVWKVSAGDLSGEFIVDDAAGAAMDSFLRANLQPQVAP
jgi:hypothetical protein